MMEKNYAAKVNEVIFSTPGMAEMVPITGKISRRSILHLSSMISKGLGGDEQGGDELLLANLPKEVGEELMAFAAECLKKGGLVEFSEKLKGLNGK